MDSFTSSRFPGELTAGVTAWAGVSHACQYKVSLPVRPRTFPLFLSFFGALLTYECAGMGSGRALCAYGEERYNYRRPRAHDCGCSHLFKFLIEFNEQAFPRTRVIFSLFSSRLSKSGNSTSCSIGDRARRPWSCSRASHNPTAHQSRPTIRPFFF